MYFVLAFNLREKEQIFPKKWKLFNILKRSLLFLWITNNSIYSIIFQYVHEHTSFVIVFYARSYRILPGVLPGYYNFTDRLSAIFKKGSM